MTVEADPLLLTGQLLVNAGVVTPERLAATLANQVGHRARRWPGKRIGHHLVTENVVKSEVLEALLRQRDRAPLEAGAARLGNIAVRNGLLSEADLHTCLAEQDATRKAGRSAENLGRMLVKKRLVSEHALQAALDRQKALLGAAKK